MLHAEGISHIGPFKNIVVPSGWESSQEDAGTQPGYRYQYLFASPDKKAEIRIFHFGVPLNQQDGHDFAELLSANKNLPQTKLLYDFAWENDPEYSLLVQSLAGALGRNSIGDNQFTNTAKPGDRYAPVFKLERLELRSIAGRTVLAVSGSFRHLQTGEATTYYRGIVADNEVKPNGNTIHEAHKICLQADQLDSFEQSCAAYEELLKTVEWCR